MDDLILRQDAIDAIQDEISKESHRPHQITLLHAKRRIENLPSAQQWITVSEKLPELGHRVLFKMWNNDVYIGVLLKLNDGLKITLEPTGIGYVYSFENVIAWMSLPE